MGDWGRVAYIDTLSRLRENEILYTGGGFDKQSAEQPTIIEKYGIKIGYLGFSDQGPNWMGANTDLAGVLLANNPRFDEIIKNASTKVDYLVVSFHFGDEYQTIHNARQELLAHKAIDNGAKIVIGHHPHVMEDVEVYKNGYIAYSLGNLIFDQGYYKPEKKQGLILEVKLGSNKSMTVKKNIVKLNSVFQPDKVILGKEEKIKFQTPAPIAP
jgi:poly-gamma-glutamate synthesis protein (capsule biosynthesis protein)